MLLHYIIVGGHISNKSLSLLATVCPSCQAAVATSDLENTSSRSQKTSEVVAHVVSSFPDWPRGP